MYNLLPENVCDLPSYPDKILRDIWGVGVFELRVGLTIQGGVNFPRVGLYPSSELWVGESFQLPNEDEMFDILSATDNKISTSRTINVIISDKKTKLQLYGKKLTTGSGVLVSMKISVWGHPDGPFNTTVR